MSLFPLFGNDNRGKATAWSLFGNATAVAAQDSSQVSSVQSLNTTVEDLKKLVGNGAQLTSAVAGFLGDQRLADDASKLHQLMLK